MSMKTMRLFSMVLGGLLVLVAITLTVSGCGGKKEIVPVAVGEMEVYHDPVLGYNISYPKGWIPDVEAGRRARFWSVQDVGKRFLDPTGPYPDGALIGVEVIKTADPAAETKKILEELAAANVVLGQQEPITVKDKPAIRVSSTANFGKGTVAYTDRVFIGADSLLYEMDFGGINDQYAIQKLIFDASLASFEFPKPAVAGADETLPSATMNPYDAKLFTFEYPDNFNFVTVPKGSNDLVLALRGVRQDCSIRFDVFGAKGQTVEKVVEQNKGKFAGAQVGKATVGGQPAMTLTYSATKDVERRFYFVVKDDKVYRTTMDWYKPQRAEYLAAYDKVISSIKFK
jgi:hypothetical protein